MTLTNGVLDDVSWHGFARLAKTLLISLRYAVLDGYFLTPCCIEFSTFVLICIGWRNDKGAHEMKYDSLIILTAINGGLLFWASNDADGIFFFTMSVIWLALALIVGNKEDKMTDNINPAHYKKARLSASRHSRPPRLVRLASRQFVPLTWLSTFGDMKKNVEDLRKARWYLDRLIKEVMEKMNVLSLFDGMSCGQIALNRIGIKPTVYCAAEMDKAAITVTKDNCKDISNLATWPSGVNGILIGQYWFAYWRKLSVIQSCRQATCFLTTRGVLFFV